MQQHLRSIYKHDNYSAYTCLIITCLLLLSSSALANEKELLSLLQETFANKQYTERTVWLNNEVKINLSKTLARNYKQLRVKYWQHTNTSVWVLNEIGKTLPITTAIVIKNSKISKIKILQYQSHHGYQVQQKGFLKQFIGKQLTNDKLNSKVDSISGATFSSRSLIRMAEAALILEQFTIHAK